MGTARRRRLLRLPEVIQPSRSRCATFAVTVPQATIMVPSAAMAAKGSSGDQSGRSTTTSAGFNKIAT
uniref:Uncharacterized protein n=1 Tax=Panagrolaimus sp. JU765 TaxID=591449 RepID=A0AC34PXQ0_9BILA